MGTVSFLHAVPSLYDYHLLTGSLKPRAIFSTPLLGSSETLMNYGSDVNNVFSEDAHKNEYKSYLQP